MQRNVTLIISNAWRLDFNLGVTSFEPNIQSIRHLVDFALSSTLQQPPRIVNVSSVSSIGSKAPDANNTIAEDLSEKCEATPIGYGQSKYVSERILSTASSKTGLQTCSLRVGQLSGSRTNGAWNSTDSYPMQFKSAETLGCLPRSKEVRLLRQLLKC
jgi:thioester reductase-like protein